MSEQNKSSSLDGLVEAATDSVRQQQEKADAFAAKRPPQPKLKMIFALILLAAFGGALIYQYPRIVEPYALPDPKTNPTVVEAELETISSLIETYRLSQGKYPDSLDKVLLPAYLAEVVKNSKLTYQANNSSYVLDWTLPRWHAVLDGETGKVAVTPANAGK